MLKIIDIANNPIDKNLIDLVYKHLLCGNIIIYPTDTCYGIGVIYSNKQALANVCKLKKRNPDKKVSVIIPSINWLSQKYKINAKQKNILQKYLPGKYTFIIKNENESIGVRIPDNNFTKNVIQHINEPVTTTSANISGEQNPYSIKDLRKGILRNPEINNYNILVIDSGELDKNKISTVIDLSKTSPKIVRQGSGSFDRKF